MPELKGQLSICDIIKDELDGEPTASRAIKLLDYAYERGWDLNPAASFVVRLTRDDGLPFYFRYDLAFQVETGKRSWKFAGAMARNGQKLNYNDIKTYLDDPAVIFPEPPDGECEAAQYDDPDQTTRGALGAVAPISRPDPAYVDGPPKRPGFGEPAPPTRAPMDWGALLA